MNLYCTYISNNEFKNKYLQYDNETEEQAILEYKLSRLDALEARWRADIEHDPGYYASSYSSWLNYGTSLVTNIIENLQLNIKDVHIRYEDGITLSDGKQKVIYSHVIIM